MKILAIDPGNMKSGWVVYGDGRVLRAGIAENQGLLESIRRGLIDADLMAIEMVASYGMPVGRDVFDTVWWIGRFTQVWRKPDEVRLVYRRDVKLELCGSARAKDANVRASLIDRFGPGRALAIGTKQKPGPLYGVSGDAWAALAVAFVAERCAQQARAA